MQSRLLDCEQIFLEGKNMLSLAASLQPVLQNGSSAVQIICVMERGTYLSFLASSSGRAKYVETYLYNCLDLPP